MPFNPNEKNVILSYIAVTGAAPTQAQFEDAFELAGLGALASQLVDGDTQSAEDFVTSLYNNLLVTATRPIDQGGLEFWVANLVNGDLTKAELVASFVQVAQTDAAVDGPHIEGLLAGIDSLEGGDNDFGTEPSDPTDPTDPVDPVDPAELNLNRTFDTTIGESEFSGWTNNPQNQPGQDFEQFQSNTNKIFNVGLTALEQGVNTISAQYTFNLSDQLGESGSYEAYFLSPILNNTVDVQGNSLVLELIDRHAANDDEALLFVAVEAFTFSINGELVTVASEDILSATTYPELLAAIQAELAELGLDNVVEARLGGTFQRQQTDPNTQQTTGEILNGTQIVIEALGSQELTAGNFITGVKADAARPNIDPAARMDVTDLSITSNLISTNLVLENVGFGSQGGSVNLSGQSQSLKGIQEFNVEALDKQGLPVWLTALSSSPLRAQELNLLEVINLSGSALNFHIGEQDGEGVEQRGDGGIVDVREFNAASFGGNVRIDATVTHNVITRDLDREDTQANPSADNVTYDYNFGGGDDVLFMDFSREAIAREDVALSINMGGGNNTVFTEFFSSQAANLTTNWYNDQANLDNFSVTTGSGDDFIWTYGGGDAVISAGAGNDVVYTDNSGLDIDGFGPVSGAVAEFGINPTSATWVFADNNVINDLTGIPVTPFFLPQGRVTVAFSASEGVMGVAGAAASLTNGFEVAVNLPTGSGFIVDQRQLAQAVKDAINNSPVLSNLLTAIDGPDNTLIVDSLIDGLFANDALEVIIDTPWTAGAPFAGTTAAALATETGLSQNQVNSIATAYRDFVNDSTLSLQDALNDAATEVNTNVGIISGSGALDAEIATHTILGDFDGAAATDEASDNTINLGSGNDVLVLSTNVESNETIVFTGFNQGRNTIVNFDDDGLSTGVDALDFTAYLQTNERTATGASSTSQDRIDTAFGAAASLAANEVTIIDFVFDATAPTQTFASLTANALLAAVNGDGDYANLVAGSLVADNAAANFGNAVGEIVGNSQDHVVLVQNAGNEGEYLMFKLTSVSDDAANVDAGDFATAQLIGTVDFGAEITGSDDILV